MESRNHDNQPTHEKRLMNRLILTVLTPLALLASTSLLHAQRHGSFRPSGGSSPAFRPGGSGFGSTHSFRPSLGGHNTLSNTFKPNHHTTFNHNSHTTFKPNTHTTFNHNSHTTFKPNHHTTFKPGTHTTVHHKPHLGHLPKVPATVKVPLHAGHSGRIAVHHYASVHGAKFKGGVFYRGRGHGHWTRRCYSPNHRCWCWFCPSTSVWYYWCGARGCYLPVTCLTIAPPTIESADLSEAEVPPEGQSVPEVGPDDLPELPKD